MKTFQKYQILRGGHYFESHSMVNIFVSHKQVIHFGKMQSYVLT